MSKYVLTRQEYDEWRENQVTKFFMKALFLDREVLKEMLLTGSDNDEELRGRAKALTLIIGLTYEDLVMSLSEREDRE